MQLPDYQIPGNQSLYLVLFLGGSFDFGLALPAGVSGLPFLALSRALALVAGALMVLETPSDGWGGYDGRSRHIRKSPYNKWTYKWINGAILARRIRLFKATSVFVQLAQSRRICSCISGLSKQSTHMIYSVIKFKMHHASHLKISIGRTVELRKVTEGLALRVTAHSFWTVSNLL